MDCALLAEYSSGLVNSSGGYVASQVNAVKGNDQSISDASALICGNSESCKQLEFITFDGGLILMVVCLQTGGAN
jgi:hypothetical protein